MSIRFLPAALLPSGDKVVSTLANAHQWVVKLSEGIYFFKQAHTHTFHYSYHAIVLFFLYLAHQADTTMKRKVGPHCCC